MYDKLRLHNKPVRIDCIPDSLHESLTPVLSIADRPVEVIINTITSLNELTPIATAFLEEKNLKPIVLYIIYPKKSTINRDTLMTEGLKLGLNAIKLIRVNDDFNCMGFKCTHDVEANKAKRPSQCVDDYRDKIGLLKERLTTNQTAFDFYKGLTLGYQKDWARFVYSAVKPETQQSRFEQLCQALESRHKSVDHYKASLKLKTKSRSSFD